MTTLYQYCDKCKTERNFDVTTLKCITCKNNSDENKNRSYN